MQSQQLELRKAHRRSRVPLSCDPCRSRKLKCNREKPCQNCTARNEQVTCKFRRPLSAAAGSAGNINSPTALRGASPAQSLVGGDRSDASSNFAGYRSDAGINGESMRQRIVHLEDLVRRLIAERPLPLSPPQSSTGASISTPEKTPEKTPGTDSSDAASSDDLLAAATGKTVMDGLRSVYIGGDDLSVVLQEINELKRTWNQHEQDDMFSDHNLRSAPSHTVDGSSLLYDQVKPLDRISILSSLPPKHEVDWLIAQFFDRQNFPIAIPPILHEPTFMREYAAHWKDPSSTDFIWLGLIFSILGITMLAFLQYGEPPEYEGLSESFFQLYRMRTAQCLLNGDVAKCLPYTVETLRFNATAELNRRDDNRRGLWIMTGVVVRAAVNMGYHRDPGSYPSPSSSGISTLQAEYRRRVWSSVVSMDDMASFLGGFPRTMSALYADALEPRNVHDWELVEDMVALPPSRPLADTTAATYLIVKGRLFRELGRVADFNSTPTLGSYDTVLEIDRALAAVYDTFPPYMKVSAQTLPSAPLATPPPTAASVGAASAARSSSPANFSNMSLVGMYHRGMCTLHRKFLAKAHNQHHEGGGGSGERFRLSRDRCVASALGLLAFQELLEPAFYRISQTRQMLMLGAMVLFLELALRRKNANSNANMSPLLQRRDEDDGSPSSAALLAALERSCVLLEKAMDVCEEARRVHQFLIGLLSSFRTETAAAATVSAVEVPADQLLFSGLPDGGSPPFDAAVPGSFSFEMDFDWATWDTYIEETGYETGPTY